MLVFFLVFLRLWGLEICQKLNAPQANFWKKQIEKHNEDSKFVKNLMRHKQTFEKTDWKWRFEDF